MFSFSFQVGNENYDFIPLNQALCLSSTDVDSTESKLDELLNHVTGIAKKQKEEVELSFFLKKLTSLNLNLKQNSF